MWVLLTTILVRPRQTIGSIVTESRSRVVVPLVLLATASAVMRDVRGDGGARRGAESSGRSVGPGDGLGCALGSEPLLDLARRSDSDFFAAGAAHRDRRIPDIPPLVMPRVVRYREPGPPVRSASAG